MIGDWLNRWLPPGASSHAAEFDGVLSATHTEGALILIGWLVLFLVMLVRFRARPGGRPGPPAGRTWPLVAIVAVVLGDVWLLAGSALPAWFRRAEPPPMHANEVRVVAEQFAWNVHYPGPDGPCRTSKRKASSLQPEERDSKIVVADLVSMGELYKASRIVEMMGLGEVGAGEAGGYVSRGRGLGYRPVPVIERHDRRASGLLHSPVRHRVGASPALINPERTRRPAGCARRPDRRMRPADHRPAGEAGTGSARCWTHHRRPSPPA